MTATLPTAPLDLSPLTLSCLVAGVATVAVTPIGVWAAWRLSRMRRGPVRWAWETLFSLPLVLPPTVVGFALLLVLGRGTAFGAWVNDSLGHIAMLVYLAGRRHRCNHYGPAASGANSGGSLCKCRRRSA